MQALVSPLPYKLFSFPNEVQDKLPLPLMNPPIRSNDWIYCLNSFRQYSPLQSYSFVGDRDFTLKSCQDAIVNNLHCQQDIALNIVSPTHGLSLHPVDMPIASETSKKPMQHEKSEHDKRKYLEYLLIETRLLSELIPKSRTVNYLHVSHPVPLLFGPAELTELMYNLSKQFTLRHDGSGRYVMELVPSQCNDSQVALIKGLGFNHICLELTSNEFTEENCEKVQLFRDYEFKSVHTRILIDKNNQSENKNQLAMLIKAQPDSICVLDAHSDERSLPHTKLPPLSWGHNELIAGGYSKSCCRRYTKNDYKDAWCIHDLLTIGIGGTTFVDNIFTHNADQLDQYYDLLAQNKLPFVAGGYIHKEK